MWKLFFAKHITLFPLNAAVWLCISCFQIFLDWSCGAVSSISQILKTAWMLHKIILNIAFKRHLTTIYAVTMLFSHISSYKEELYVNHNLLNGDESLIFYRRYCVLGWVVSFRGEVLFGQIQCLRINKQHKCVGKRVLWTSAALKTLFLCQLHDRDG